MEKEELKNNKKIFGKARQRANFKIHIVIAILVLAFLWVIWAFIFKNVAGEGNLFLKCIVFLSIVWLLVLISHYLIVYKWNKNLIDRELEKLIKESELKKEKENKLQSEETNQIANNTIETE